MALRSLRKLIMSPVPCAEQSWSIPRMISNFGRRNPFGSLANYKWWVLFAVSVGLFTSVFDHGSVNVALPSIADHFNTDLPTTQWIVIGYGLTISALLLPMGRLSDILGRKIIYVL